MSEKLDRAVADLAAIKPVSDEKVAQIIQSEIRIGRRRDRLWSFAVLMVAIMAFCGLAAYKAGTIEPIDSITISVVQAFCFLLGVVALGAHLIAWIPHSKELAEVRPDLAPLSDSQLIQIYEAGAGDPAIGKFVQGWVRSDHPLRHYHYLAVMQAAEAVAQARRIDVLSSQLRHQAEIAG